MILYDISEPVPLVELSVRIGVSPSTTSIMVTRMLQTEEPLVAKTVDPVDARSALISLTPAGRRPCSRISTVSVISPKRSRARNAKP